MRQDQVPFGEGPWNPANWNLGGWEPFGAYGDRPPRTRPEPGRLGLVRGGLRPKCSTIDSITPPSCSDMTPKETTTRKPLPPPGCSMMIRHRPTALGSSDLTGSHWFLNCIFRDLWPLGVAWLHELFGSRPIPCKTGRRPATLWS